MIPQTNGAVALCAVALVVIAAAVLAVGSEWWAILLGSAAFLAIWIGVSGRSVR